MRFFALYALYWCISIFTHLHAYSIDMQIYLQDHKKQTLSHLTSANTQFYVNIHLTHCPEEKYTNGQYQITLIIYDTMRKKVYKDITGTHSLPNHIQNIQYQFVIPYKSNFQKEQTYQIKVIYKEIYPEQTITSVVEKSLANRLRNDAHQNPLAQIRLIAPYKDMSINTRYPKFRWNIIPNTISAHYTIWVSENKNPIENFIWKKTQLSQTYITYPTDASSLKTNTTYYWQIQALDQNGQPIHSKNGLSSIYNFTIRGRTKIRIITPNTTSILLDKLHFIWETNPDTAYYLLQIFTQANQTNKVNNENLIWAEHVNNNQLKAPEQLQKIIHQLMKKEVENFTWQVQAYDKNDHLQTSSKKINFSILPNSDTSEKDDHKDKTVSIESTENNPTDQQSSHLKITITNNLSQPLGKASIILLPAHLKNVRIMQNLKNTKQLPLTISSQWKIFMADEYGHANIKCNYGNYFIMVYKEDHNLYQKKISIKKNSHQTLSIQLSSLYGIFKGHVKDLETTEPISHAKIELTSRYHKSYAITDNNGYFHIKKVTNSNYYLEVHKDDTHMPLIQKNIKITGIQLKQEYQLKRIVSGTLEGTILHKYKLHPIPNARVWIQPLRVSANTKIGIIRNELLSNESGQFYIPNLRPGTYRIFCTEDSFSQTYQDITIAPGNIENIKIYLDNKKYTIRGQVIDSNKYPLYQAKIFVQNLPSINTAISDQNGNFVSHLPIGHHTLNIIFPGKEIHKIKITVIKQDIALDPIILYNAYTNIDFKVYLAIPQKSNQLYTDKLGITILQKKQHIKEINNQNNIILPGNQSYTFRFVFPKYIAEKYLIEQQNYFIKQRQQSIRLILHEKINIQWKITDQFNQGIPWAKITDRNRNISLKSDQNGAFIYQTPIAPTDSLYQFMIQHPKYQSKIVTINPKDIRIKKIIHITLFSIQEQYAHILEKDIKKNIQQLSQKADAIHEKQKNWINEFAIFIKKQTQVFHTSQTIKPCWPNTLEKISINWNDENNPQKWSMQFQVAENWKKCLEHLYTDLIKPLKEMQNNIVQQQLKFIGEWNQYNIHWHNTSRDVGTIDGINSLTDVSELTIQTKTEIIKLQETVKDKVFAYKQYITPKSIQDTIQSFLGISSNHYLSKQQETLDSLVQEIEKYQKILERNSRILNRTLIGNQIFSTFSNNTPIQNLQKVLLRFRSFENTLNQKIQPLQDTWQSQLEEKKQIIIKAQQIYKQILTWEKESNKINIQIDRFKEKIKTLEKYFEMQSLLGFDSHIILKKTTEPWAFNIEGYLDISKQLDILGLEHQNKAILPLPKLQINLTEILPKVFKEYFLKTKEGLETQEKKVQKDYSNTHDTMKNISSMVSKKWRMIFASDYLAQIQSLQTQINQKENAFAAEIFEIQEHNISLEDKKLLDQGISNLLKKYGKEKYFPYHNIQANELFSHLINSSDTELQRYIKKIITHHTTQWQNNKKDILKLPLSTIHSYKDLLNPLDAKRLPNLLLDIKPNHNLIQALHNFHFSDLIENTKNHIIRLLSKQVIFDTPIHSTFAGLEIYLKHMTLSYMPSHNLFSLKAKVQLIWHNNIEQLYGIENITADSDIHIYSNGRIDTATLNFSQHNKKAELLSLPITIASLSINLVKKTIELHGTLHLPFIQQNIAFQKAIFSYQNSWQLISLDITMDPPCKIGYVGWEIWLTHVLYAQNKLIFQGKLKLGTPFNRELNVHSIIFDREGKIRQADLQGFSLPLFGGQLSAKNVNFEHQKQSASLLLRDVNITLPSIKLNDLNIKEIKITRNQEGKLSLNIPHISIPIHKKFNFRGIPIKIQHLSLHFENDMHYLQIDAMFNFKFPLLSLQIGHFTINTQGQLRVSQFGIDIKLGIVTLKGNITYNHNSFEGQGKVSIINLLHINAELKFGGSGWKVIFELGSAPINIPGTPLFLLRVKGGLEKEGHAFKVTMGCTISIIKLLEGSASITLNTSNGDMYLEGDAKILQPLPMRMGQYEGVLSIANGMFEGEANIHYRVAGVASTGTFNYYFNKASWGVGAMAHVNVFNLFHANGGVAMGYNYPTKYRYKGNFIKNPKIVQGLLFYVSAETSNINIGLLTISFSGDVFIYLSNQFSAGLYAHAKTSINLIIIRAYLDLYVDLGGQVGRQDTYFEGIVSAEGCVKIIRLKKCVKKTIHYHIGNRPRQTNETVNTTEIEQPKFLSVKGKIRDNKYRILKRVSVSLYDSSKHLIQQTTSNHRGNFTFHNIQSKEEKYILELNHPLYKSVKHTFPLSYADYHPDLEMQKIPLPNKQIKIYVIDQNKQTAIPYVKCRVVDMQDQQPHHKMAHSNAGVITIQNVYPNHTYSITLEKNPYEKLHFQHTVQEVDSLNIQTVYLTINKKIPFRLGLQIQFKDTSSKYNITHQENKQFLEYIKKTMKVSLLSENYQQYESSKVFPYSQLPNRPITIPFMYIQSKNIDQEGAYTIVLKQKNIFKNDIYLPILVNNKHITFRDNIIDHCPKKIYTICYILPTPKKYLTDMKILDAQTKKPIADLNIQFSKHISLKTNQAGFTRKYGLYNIPVKGQALRQNNPTLYKDHLFEYIPSRESYKEYSIRQKINTQKITKNKQNTNPTKEQQNTNPAKEQQNTNPAKEQQNTNPAKEQQNTNPAKEQQNTNPTKEQQNTNPTKEQQNTNPTKEQQNTNPTKEQQNTNPAKEQQNTNPAKEQQNTNPTKEQQNTNPAKEQQNTNPAKEQQKKIEKENVPQFKPKEIHLSGLITFVNQWNQKIYSNKFIDSLNVNIILPDTKIQDISLTYQMQNTSQLHWQVKKKFYTLKEYQIFRKYITQHKAQISILYKNKLWTQTILQPQSTSSVNIK